jgi:hypothetical protein
LRTLRTLHYIVHHTLQYAQAHARVVRRDKQLVLRPPAAPRRGTADAVPRRRRARELRTIAAVAAVLRRFAAVSS